MAINPKIVTFVDRVASAWVKYPMSMESKLEFQQAFRDLDPAILHKALDQMRTELKDRPEIPDIIQRYGEIRPAPRAQGVRIAHPYDMARQLVEQQRASVVTKSKPLFDQITTKAGKSALRQYLSAAAWVMAQGVIAAQTSQWFQMTSDRIATGYLAWTPPGEDLREARRLFNRGRELGRIEIEVPVNAMNWFKAQKDPELSMGSDVKRVPVVKGERTRSTSPQPA